MSAKVIARIKGGLGNQLFCYAAARRLALVNNAELVIDDVSGFARDSYYRRGFCLDQFRIQARKATPAERLEPFERYRRGILKWSSRKMPFTKRRYIEQEYLELDERLLSVTVKGTVYLDGLWQSEVYFKDIEQIIRKDLTIEPPKDFVNYRMAKNVSESTSIALHMRWFDSPKNVSEHNLSVDYYRRALSFIKRKLHNPHFFLFSDDPDAAKRALPRMNDHLTVVTQNASEEFAYADIWLMSQCKHFIIANSTFSWWGAWLSTNESKLIVAPKVRMTGKSAWGFKGLLPESWIQL